MNSEEIRELNRMAQEKCLETKTVAEHEAGLDSLAISVLTEIAAQLAELNESRKPRWVWVSYLTNRYPVDATEVSAIMSRSERQSFIYLRGIEEPWTVDMPIEMLADKLGIPPQN